MTDHRHEDRLIRDALRDMAGAPDPTPADIARVLEQASRPTPRRRRAAGLIAAAVLLLGAGTVAAVPPARAAVETLLGDINDFFGGGDAPGRPVPANEQPGALNWLGDATKDSPRILAQLGDLRLVAYRQKNTGDVCFSVGTAATECGPGQQWRRTRFAGRSLVGLIVTTTDTPATKAFWGVTDDPRITTVRVRYASRPDITAEVGANGWVMLVPTGVTPTGLDALDHDGRVVGQGTVNEPNLEWDAQCVKPEGCG